jgi:hypothetical protein
MHGDETDVTFNAPVMPKDKQNPPSHIVEDYCKARFNSSEINKGLYYERVTLWWKKSKALRDIYIDNEAYMAAPSFQESGLLTDGVSHQYCLSIFLHDFSNVSSVKHGEKVLPISKARFYRAVIGRFLDIKVLQFWQLFQDYEGSEQWFDRITATLSNHHLRSFRESLEMLEILDFTYFLIAKQVKLERLSVEPENGPMDLHSWGRLIELLHFNLTPFDIFASIEVQPTLNVLLQHFVGVEFVGMRTYEQDVAHKVKIEASSPQLILYRESDWRRAVRGQCFSDLFDEERVAKDIRQFQFQEDP